MATATRASRRMPADARRRGILAAAKGVFGSNGYHATTTRDIAAAAGVSEALLYQHFEGKRQLFEAVIHSAAEDLAQRLGAAGSAPDPLVAALEAYFDFVEEEADLYQVFFRQALQADAAFAGLYRELSRRLLVLCETSLGAALRLPASRRDVVAHALAGMVTELGLWWAEDPSRSKRDLIGHAVRIGRAIYLAEVTDD